MGVGISIGDRIPDATLYESLAFGEACPVSPGKFSVAEATKGVDEMGRRMKRFSMLVDDGVVKQLNIEAPSKFEVSDAATMLKQLG